MSEIIESVRLAFLALVADRRVSFGHDHKAKFKAFCHEHDYRQRWPAEALRLAQDETRTRTLELKSRLADAIEAGWNPSPTFTVAQAIARCFIHTDFEEDPTSDLRDFVRGAFEQVGLGSTAADLDRQQRDLGAAQVRVYKMTLHDLEIQATKKYGSYRTVEYNEQFRLRVLRSLNEYFASSREPIYTVGVVQRLDIEDNLENRRLVGNALRYWHQKQAIQAVESRALHAEFPALAVFSITGIGTDRIEGLSESKVTVQHTYHVSDSTVGVIGTMSGGMLTQSVGASFGDLATALERLRDEMQISEEPLAPAIEATAEKAALLARTEHLDHGILERVLSSLGQTLQSVAAVPQAWAFVAVEAAKAGFNIPGPPVLPH